MARTEWIKDPDAVLDYKWDFAPNTNGVSGADSDWLDTTNGEIINVATVTAGTGVEVDNPTAAADAGLTVDSSARTDTNTSVTAWLSGGTAGFDYPVTCHIETDNATAREDDRTMMIKVRER